MLSRIFWLDQILIARSLQSESLPACCFNLTPEISRQLDLINETCISSSSSYIFTVVSLCLDFRRGSVTTLITYWDISMLIYVSTDCSSSAVSDCNERLIIKTGILLTAISPFSPLLLHYKLCSLQCTGRNPSNVSLLSIMRSSDSTESFERMTLKVIATKGALFRLLYIFKEHPCAISNWRSIWFVFSVTLLRLPED